MCISLNLDQPKSLESLGSLPEAGQAQFAARSSYCSSEMSIVSSYMVAHIRFSGIVTNYTVYSNLQYASHEESICLSCNSNTRVCVLEAHVRPETNRYRNTYSPIGLLLNPIRDGCFWPPQCAMASRITLIIRIKIAFPMSLATLDCSGNSAAWLRWPPV